MSIDAGIAEILGESRHARIARVDAALVVTILQGHSERGAARFPDTEDGNDDAWALYLSATRRGRLLSCQSALAVIAVAAAAIWLIAALLNAALVLRSIGHQDVGGDAWLWLQELQQVGSDIFIAAVGIYGVTWLYRRGIPNQAK